MSQDLLDQLIDTDCRLYDRETRMSIAVSLLDKGDIAGARRELTEVRKVRDTWESSREYER